MAEGLGSGLQIRLRRFKSGHHLHSNRISIVYIKNQKTQIGEVYNAIDHFKGLKKDRLQAGFFIE